MPHGFYFFPGMYSGLWFLQGKQTSCLLFQTEAEALTWARDRVDEYGGGAIVLATDTSSVWLLGKFGKLPPALQRELVGEPIPLDHLTSARRP
jgi:hypothetical protein